MKYFIILFILSFLIFIIALKYTKYINNIIFINEIPDTIPMDVHCNKIKRCDTHGICAIICERGSVQIHPWLQFALKYQRNLNLKKTLCNVQFPGSHNSGITLADGYGIEDHIFNKLINFISYFRFIKSYGVHTNDQYFSLTDQLNMGIRLIELDVHWFESSLRIAHCGGFHTSLLDHLIIKLNQLIKSLGLDESIKWDTETIGCKPSLSSIPANEQRLLKSALIETKNWLDRNHNEFLIIFFDDQNDLYRWNKVHSLMDHIDTIFNKSEIFTPKDFNLTGNQWPIVENLIKKRKRIVFLSGSYYGNIGNKYLFFKERICHWMEPSLKYFKDYPSCTFLPNVPKNHKKQIIRPQTSEIQYGFLNAEGHYGKNKLNYLLNEITIPKMMDCNINMPSPDNITPKRMESFVWSWEKDQPNSNNQIKKDQCIALMKETRKWRAVPCNQRIDVFTFACQSRINENQWISYELNKNNISDVICPINMTFSSPVNGYQNKILYDELKKTSENIKGVYINVKL